MGHYFPNKGISSPNLVKIYSQKTVSSLVISFSDLITIEEGYNLMKKQSWRGKKNKWLTMRGEGEGRVIAS